MALARFLPDGDPDPAFGTNGLAVHPTVSTSTLGGPDGFKDWSMVRRPGGGFLVGYGAHDGDTRPRVAAFDEDGSIDSTYATDGVYQFTGSNAVGSGLWVDADGSVLHFIRLSNGGNEPGAIVKLTSNGQPDAGFGTNGVVQSPFNTRSIAHGLRLPGGDIIAYGINNNTGAGSVVHFTLDAEANALPVITNTYPDLVVSGGGSIQWFLDGTPITGATGSTHTPTQNGIYTVEMNSFGCVNTSPPFQFLSTGITEVAADIAFRQDLVGGRLFIQNNAVATVWLLVDASGRALRQGVLHSGANEVSTTDLRSGVYLLRCGRQVHRFVMP